MLGRLKDVAMRAISLKTFVLIILCPLVAYAQQLAEPPTPGRARTVANEDGGQAFIIETGGGRLSAFGRPRKITIARPEQCSVFLGSQWQTTELSALAAKLQNLLSNVTDEGELRTLEHLGLKNRFGPTVSAELPDINPGSFSDLDIQRLLGRMMELGEVPRPSSSTIYVLFLGPDFRSTLGPLTGGKHYVAYHSVFRAEGTITRYVVVPFQSNSANAYQTALKSFVAAAEGPAYFAR